MSWLSSIKSWGYAAMAGAMGLLVILLRHAQRGRDKAEEKARQEKARAEASERTRDTERKVQERQREVDSEAQDAERERKSRPADERPTGSFGDSRLRDNDD